MTTLLIQAHDPRCEGYEATNDWTSIQITL